MDDPAIVAKSKGSSPSKLHSSQVIHSPGKGHASKQGDATIQEATQFEDRLRGMVRSQDTARPDTSTRLMNDSQQRISAAALPPHRAQQAGHDAKSTIAFPASDGRSDFPGAGQTRNSGQIPASNRPHPNSTAHPKRANQQRRRQKGTVNLQDVQQPTPAAGPLQPPRNRPAPTRGIPPQPPRHPPASVHGLPPQSPVAEPTSGRRTPPHLRPPGNDQQQPHYQRHRQPSQMAPTQPAYPQQGNYGMNQLMPPFFNGHGLPPHQQMRAYNPTWRNNIQPQRQPNLPSRSNTQPRQLYDPHLDRRPNQSVHPSALTIQGSFLDRAASVEVAKVQISPAELEHKERLRVTLQNACQIAIVKYETLKDPTFDGTRVSLQCFGSVGSGFAMTGSDMDLALLSPASSPEAASPESEIPRLLERTLLDLGFGARLLTKTRVPIIRFCETPTKDLAEALKRARLKWQKEKDETPKPKKTEKDKKEKASKKDNDSVTAMTTEDSKDAAKAADSEQDASVKELQIDHKLEVTANTDTTAATKTLDTPDPAQKNMQADDWPPAGSGKDPRKEGGNDWNTVRSHGTWVQLLNDDERVRLYGLAMSEGWFDYTERKEIIRFISAVKTHGLDAEHKGLKSARDSLHCLPDVLSRYREPFVNPLDFPKTGLGTQCDINFSNPLALHNTHLLKCYSLCDHRVKPMVIFVKAWAKRRNINSPYHGTLSSYGYVLMILHYLMNKALPPVIPNLQRMPQAMEDTSPENDQTLDGHDVRFLRDPAAISNLAATGQLTQNGTDTVGSLLRGFYQYYAHPSEGGFNWSTDVLSLRTCGGILRKEEKGWTGAKTVTVESNIPGEDAKEVRHRYLFAIEDPFEIEHNVARTVVHNGIVAIRDEFRRAHKIIQSQSRHKPTADDLFAEAESKENLQHKFFGPLIPNFGKEKAREKKKPGEGALNTAEGKKDRRSKDELVPNIQGKDRRSASQEESPTNGVEHAGEELQAAEVLENINTQVEEDAQIR